jgi:phosphoesterase RecJ-like protein
LIASSRISRKRKTATIKKIVEEIMMGHSFLISSHKHPEGDAIGSMLALGLALKDLQKEVFLWNQDPVPENLSFLPGAENISQHVPPNGSFEVLLAVDCGDKNRLGEEFAKISRVGKIINIDHHISNSYFGDINLVDAEASSTAEIIYDLLKKIKVPLKADLAENIYVGILTDTGSFHYANTSAQAFRVARECLLAGVDPAKVAAKIYENQPLSRLRLLALVLETLEVQAAGQISLVIVTQKMLEETGATPEQTEDLINFPRSLKGTEVALLFREINHGQYRVSLRSRGKINVAQIAAEFQGGGHPNAAGCTVEGDLLTVKEKVLQRVRTALGRE